MTASGHEERYPPTKLSVGCGFRTEKDGHHGGCGRSTSNSGNVYGQAAQPVSANNEIARKGGKTTGARDPVSSSTVRASVPALKGRTPHGPPQIEPRLLVAQSCMGAGWTIRPNIQGIGRWVGLAAARMRS